MRSNRYTARAGVIGKGRLRLWFPQICFAHDAARSSDSDMNSLPRPRTFFLHFKKTAFLQRRAAMHIGSAVRVNKEMRAQTLSPRIVLSCTSVIAPAKAVFASVKDICMDHGKNTHNKPSPIRYIMQVSGQEVYCTCTYDLPVHTVAPVV